MKRLLLTLLMAGLAGCAVPYQKVQTPGEGEYYIAGVSAPGVACGSGCWDYAFSPWWYTAGYYGYSSYPFFYYSPNFYPHYFSVWSPGWHYRPHAWGGAWHPPYRYVRHVPVRRNHGPGDSTGRPADRVVAPPPPRSHPPATRVGERGSGRRIAADSDTYPVRPSTKDFPAQPTSASVAGSANRRAAAPRSPGVSLRSPHSSRAGDIHRSPPRRTSAPANRVKWPKGLRSEHGGQ